MQLPMSPAVNLPLDKLVTQQSPRPRASTTGQAVPPWRLQEPPNWTSFFHKRRVRTSRRGNVATPSLESNPANRPQSGMRIRLRRGSLPRPFLITRKMITGQTFEVEEADYELEGAGTTTEASSPIEQSSQDSNNGSSEQSEDTPTRRNRGSLSTSFGPPSAWKNRATSLRRSKRNSGEYSKSRRYASDPTSSASEDAAQLGGARPGIEDLFTPPKSACRDGQRFDAFAQQDQGRDCPSPIPSLSRLSGLQVDLSRVGPTPPSSAGLQAASPTQFSSAAGPYGAPAPTHSRAVSKEGASTLAGSEMSVPGLASGDDDTDYKSDVLFDSFRTTDTNRLVETPLDAMFDDCFPGSTKTKRLSVQEILGNSWDGNTNILEEDEGTSTPMRLREPRIADDMRDSDDRATEIAKFQLSVGDRMGRISLDTTDDDYDWANDDEVLSNPLSPPTSSVNSRRGMSPPLRSALASISGNSASDSYTISSPMERPRSNLFDWAEPPLDKSDDTLSRPKTAHGKQELDSRGGRLSNRKGHPIAHIRSQSVPVVPDPQDSSKGAPKFGTWAVGNKNASEDWDDDFDFEETSNSGSGSGTKIPSKGLSMRVPKSIQATQPSVKAHSGQIRELSLLVSSLKRLCRQGRELSLLDGEASALWKEAENIIALASPDEEEVEDSDTDRSFSDFDPSSIDERFLDEGFDAFTLDRSENSLDSHEPEISKNAVVRERQVVRRRSVFSPDDDIFGNSQSCMDPPSQSTKPLDTAAVGTGSQDGTSSSSRVSSTNSPAPNLGSHTPRTPERVREFRTPEGAVVSSVIAAMEQQRSLPSRSQESPLKPSKAKLFFDTNSLQELVKRASIVFHTLSDLVRRQELLIMSPQATPRHDWRDRDDDMFDRHDSHRRGGSPAFTRVFSDPDAGSPRHLVKSQKSHSSMPRKSLDSNGLSQRMQMMTVS